MLLASCLASVLVARGQQPRAAAAQAEVQAARAQLQELEALAQRVRRVAEARPADLHAGKPLELALAETVSAAMERRVNDAISLETLAVTTGGGVTRVSPLSEMARAVPHSGGQLRVVTLRIKGAYGHYQGLRDYLSSFAALPVAVTDFTASERSFELMLAVFGS